MYICPYTRMYLSIIQVVIQPSVHSIYLLIHPFVMYMLPNLRQIQSVFPRFEHFLTSTVFMFIETLNVFNVNFLIQTVCHTFVSKILVGVVTATVAMVMMMRHFSGTFQGQTKLRKKTETFSNIYRNSNTFNSPYTLINRNQLRS